jgi:hypothetical protein
MNGPPESAPAQTCLRCGAAMVCNPGPECWCAALPFQPMPASPAGCLCPSCLARGSAERSPPT